jgi:Flp pilus assembly protein TadD
MRGLVAGVAMAWAIGAMPLAHADAYESEPDLAKRDVDYAAAKEAMRQKDWPEAVRLLQRTAVREPDSADLQNLLGYSYRNLGQLEPAFAHYKRALVLDPRHRGAHEYIGETYLMAGDLAGAEKHLAALRNICLLPCEELGDLERAIASYRAKGAR